MSINKKGKKYIKQCLKKNILEYIIEYNNELNVVDLDELTTAFLNASDLDNNYFIMYMDVLDGKHLLSETIEKLRPNFIKFCTIDNLIYYIENNNTIFNNWYYDWSLISSIFAKDICNPHALKLIDTICNNYSNSVNLEAFLFQLVDSYEYFEKLSESVDITTPMSKNSIIYHVLDYIPQKKEELILKIVPNTFEDCFMLIDLFYDNKYDNEIKNAILKKILVYVSNAHDYNMIDNIFSSVKEFNDEIIDFLCYQNNVSVLIYIYKIFDSNFLNDEYRQKLYDAVLRFRNYDIITDFVNDKSLTLAQRLASTKIIINSNNPNIILKYSENVKNLTDEEKLLLKKAILKTRSLFYIALFALLVDFTIVSDKCKKRKDLIKAVLVSEKLKDDQKEKIMNVYSHILIKKYSNKNKKNKKKILN